MIISSISLFFKEISNIKGSLLAVDYGKKNVGIAVSDLNRQIAMPLCILNNNVKLINNIISIIDEQKGCGIVMGWPLDMNGGVHKISENILELCKNIHSIKRFPVLLFDESMSTKMALDKVYSLNTKRGDKFIKKIGKNKDDHLAAQHILESVLNTKILN